MKPNISDVVWKLLFVFSAQAPVGGHVSHAQGHRILIHFIRGDKSYCQNRVFFLPARISMRFLWKKKKMTWKSGSRYKFPLPLNLWKRNLHTKIVKWFRALQNATNEMKLKKKNAYVLDIKRVEFNWLYTEWMNPFADPKAAPFRWCVYTCSSDIYKPAHST